MTTKLGVGYNGKDLIFFHAWKLLKGSFAPRPCNSDQ